MAYLTSRYINTIVCTCQVLVLQKSFAFVVICKTNGDHGSVVISMEMQ